MKMNENLERLLPNPFAVDYSGTTEPIDLYTEKEMVKFAESIIKECIKTVHATTDESIDLMRNLDENAFWIESDIKRYFGVE